MAMHPWKTRISTILLALGCATAAHAAVLEPSDPIPAELVDSPDVEETPDPICGVCAIVIKPTSTSTSSSTAATVIIPSEEGFEGDVELILWLEGDVRTKVWIPAVTIAAADEVIVEVEAGEDWSWDEVRYAWTRMYATE